MEYILYFAGAMAGLFYWFAAKSGWNYLARALTAITVFGFIMDEARDNELHRHVHVVECATIGYVTDEDGAKYERQEDCVNITVDLTP